MSGGDWGQIAAERSSSGGRYGRELTGAQNRDMCAKLASDGRAVTLSVEGVFPSICVYNRAVGLLRVISLVLYSYHVGFLLNHVRFVVS